MSTIEVVDVITQYLMTFGPLLGDIKKRGFYPSMLDRLSIVKKYRVEGRRCKTTMGESYAQSDNSRDIPC